MLWQPAASGRRLAVRPAHLCGRAKLHTMRVVSYQNPLLAHCELHRQHDTPPALWQGAEVLEGHLLVLSMPMLKSGGHSMHIYIPTDV